MNIHLKEKCVISATPKLLTLLLVTYVLILIKLQFITKTGKCAMRDILEKAGIGNTSIFCYSIFETLMFYNVMLIESTNQP